MVFSYGLRPRLWLLIKHLIDHGIVKIGDLISNTGRFLESEKILHVQLSPIHYFKLMGIINAIPNKWRLIIKQRQQHVYSPSNETIQINIDGVNVDLLKVTSKMIYNEFKRKKQISPSAKTKSEIPRTLCGVEKDLSSLYPLLLQPTQKLENFSTNC